MTVQGFLVLLVIFVLLGLGVAVICRNGGWQGGCGGNCASCRSRCAAPKDEPKPNPPHEPE